MADTESEPRRAKPPRWDVVAPKLPGRQWTTLRGDWMQYPPTVASPGTAPADSVEDLPSLQEYVVRYAGQLTNTLPFDVADDIVGVRAGVLTESVFLLHKAAHVLGAAQVHIANGMRSWSLSSAYHAAFFGMKGVLGLLGISTVEVNSASYVLDVWSEMTRKKGNKEQPKITRILKVERVEHRQLWGFFIRMLNVADVPPDIWDEAVVAELRKLDIKEFGRQRNTIHYHIEWPLDDLHHCLVVPTFGAFATRRDQSERLDAESEDFSVALGFAIVRMGYLMLVSLGKLSAPYADEAKLLENWFQQEFNALYLQSCS